MGACGSGCRRWGVFWSASAAAWGVRDGSCREGQRQPEGMLGAMQQEVLTPWFGQKHTSSTVLRVAGCQASASGAPHQLTTDAVGCLQCAVVEEVVVAPVGGLLVLLERVVCIQQAQVVP